MATATEMLQEMTQVGLDWNVPTQEFLAQLAALSGKDDTELGAMVFTNAPAMPEAEHEEMIRRVGSELAKRIKYNATNKLFTIEKMNVTGDTIAAKAETQMYKDAAGGALFPTENVTGGGGKPIEPLSGGCMNAFFHNTGESIVTTLDAAAQMFEAFAVRMRHFANNGKALLALESKTGETGVSGPMRSVMNQAKMTTETMALASTSYVGGMFLPKTAACFMVNRNMPTTSAKFQKFYAALERVFQRISAVDTEGLSDEAALQKIGLTEKEEADLNEDTDNVWGELRRVGLAMAMAKQFKGGMATKIVKESDHYKFLMASLRAQAWTFAISAPLQVARRCGADRWLASSTMVAMERLMHSSVNTTAMLTMSETAVNLMKLLPAAPFQPFSFFVPQDDNGGEAVLVTTRTQLRHEKGLPLGCEEAMEAVNAADPQAEIDNLTAMALQGTFAQETEAERCEAKAQETVRARKAQNSEDVEFIREGQVLRIVQRGTPGTPRRLVAKHHSVTPYLNMRAPPAVGGVVTPLNEVTPDAGVQATPAAGGAGTNEWFTPQQTVAQRLFMAENEGQDDEIAPTAVVNGEEMATTAMKTVEKTTETRKETRMETETVENKKRKMMTRAGKTTQVLADAMSNKPVLGVKDWQPVGAAPAKRSKVMFNEEDEQVPEYQPQPKSLPLQSLVAAANFTMMADWNEGDNVSRNITAYTRLQSLGLTLNPMLMRETGEKGSAANLAAGF